MTDEARELISPNESEIYVVTGLGAGEETKSQTVEWLTWLLMAQVILRTGGSQCGHHVVLEDGREQMFSHFGAGTFEGAKTHLIHMVVNPVDLFTEALELEEKGVEDVFDLITIDDDCVVVTPYHGAFSRFKEILRDDDKKKGTIGKGVGEAIKDSKKGEEFTIRARELKGNAEILKAKIEAIRKLKEKEAMDIIHQTGIEELPVEAYDEIKLLHNENFVEDITESFSILADLVRIVDDAYLDRLLSKNHSIVTETSHGALHHPDSGFLPHVTQIDPTASDLIETLQHNPFSGKIKKIGVSRSYTTRHGAGPLVSFSREMTDSIQETHNNSDARANEWLGEFRSGHFDVVSMKYAIAISGGKESFDGLMISYLDILNKRSEWQVCVGYTFQGDSKDLDEYFETDGDLITGIKVFQNTNTDKLHNHQLKLTSLLTQCTPVLKTLVPSDGKNLEEVFLEFVESQVHIPVIATAHGPKKEDRRIRKGWEHLFPSRRNIRE